MDDREPMAEIARRLAGMTEEEQCEALLGYFSEFIGDMDTLTLGAFREHCRRRSEGTAVEDAMLDVIDGQLALRKIQESPSQSGPE